MNEVSLNYQSKLEINTTPALETPTWARMSEGFTSLAQAINELIYQASYLGDDGYGSSTVTGGQMTMTLNGVRVFGDPAQDYIFSDDVMYKWGVARRTQLRLTRHDGVQILWEITMARITDGGGDANKESTITLEIHGNGKPEILGGLLESLTVVSVAGTAGNTSVYVNPVIEVGNSYRVKTAATVALPLFEEDLTSWDTWNGSAEIEATTGHQIVVAEVDGTNKALKAGRATVTAG